MIPRPASKTGCILALACTLAITLATLAHAETYTINPAHLAAADTNPGSAEKPFKSLAHALNIALPGDTILAAPGNYPRLAISKTATKEQPITLKAAAAPDQKHVDKDQLINPEKLSTFPGNPRLNAVSQGFDLDNAHFIRIENFEITNVGEGVAGIFLKNCSDLQIVGNFLHDLNPQKARHGGIRADSHDVKNVLIKDNTLFRCQGTSIITMGENWVVEGNEASHGTNLNLITGENVGGEDAIRTFGKGHVIRQNYLHDFNDSEQFPKSDPHLDAFQVFSVHPEDQYASNILIENNYCSNIGQMFMGSDTGGKDNTPSYVDHFTIRGNVFKGAHAYALIIGRGCNHFTIENNTVTDSFYGAITVNVNSHHAIVRNNIYYNNSRGAIERGGKPNGPFDIDESSKEGSMFDYNLCNYEYTYPKPIEGFDKHTKLGVDPKFVDPGKGDYRLREDSPAIGAGDPALTTKDGKPLDLGAFQFNGPDWFAKFRKK